MSYPFPLMNRIKEAPTCIENIKSEEIDFFLGTKKKKEKKDNKGRVISKVARNRDDKSIQIEKRSVIVNRTVKEGNLKG